MPELGHKAGDRSNGADDSERPVRFQRGNRSIAAISRNFGENAAEFLCHPDCVAEREGFEPGRFSNRLVTKGMAKTLVNTAILT